MTYSLVQANPPQEPNDYLYFMLKYCPAQMSTLMNIMAILLVLEGVFMIGIGISELAQKPVSYSQGAQDILVGATQLGLVSFVFFAHMTKRGNTQPEQDTSNSRDSNLV